MKNKFLILLLATFGLVSCNNENEEIELPVNPPAKDIHSFVFEGQYTAQDIHLYKGPKGEKVTISEEELHKQYNEMWNMRNPSRETFTLDFEADSLWSISDYSQIGYKMDHRKDSIFGYHLGNDQEFFLGTLNKEKTTLTLYEHCYLWISTARPEDGIYGGFFMGKGKNFGRMEYDDNFFENNFESPAKMDQEGDLILWANFTYLMKKKKDGN